MMYDLRLSPEALKAAADWAVDGSNAADVELLVDDRMLLVEQGDERTAFDTNGSVGSDEYLAVAPLDRGPDIAPDPHDPGYDLWLERQGTRSRFQGDT